MSEEKKTDLPEQEVKNTAEEPAGEEKTVKDPKTEAPAAEEKTEPSE